MTEQKKMCKEEGCKEEALWGALFCWEHLVEQGKQAVNEWRKKVLENKQNLAGANLSGADLQQKSYKNIGREADFRSANLQEASLRKVNFRNASLIEANFRNASLIRANLKGAKFRKVNFRNASLDRASLQGAKLDQSDLQKANLINANLQEASLYRADLHGADLSKCNFRDADLRDIKYTEFLRLPLSVKNLIARLKLDTCVDWKWVKNLYERINSPTLWKGAIVDSVGACNPLVLKYIKDQSWLEAKLEESKKNRRSRFWMFLWGISCGYGSNIGLWLFWCGVLILSFAITYCAGWNYLFTDVSPAGWAKFGNALYGSMVTFIPMTMENLHPSGLAGKLIMLEEGILGYVMLAGLISIFANRIARLA